MVFFRHPQTGGCRATDSSAAKLTSGNSQSVRQNRINKAGARRVGAPAVFVRLVRHTSVHESVKAARRNGLALAGGVVLVVVGARNKS
jgi:hypothetical protein